MSDYHISGSSHGQGQYFTPSITSQAEQLDDEGLEQRVEDFHGAVVHSLDDEEEQRRINLYAITEEASQQMFGIDSEYQRMHARSNAKSNAI